MCRASVVPGSRVREARLLIWGKVVSSILVPIQQGYQGIDLRGTITLLIVLLQPPTILRWVACGIHPVHD